MWVASGGSGEELLCLFVDAFSSVCVCVYKYVYKYIMSVPLRWHVQKRGRGK